MGLIDGLAHGKPNCVVQPIGRMCPKPLVGDLRLNHAINATRELRSARQGIAASIMQISIGAEQEKRT